MDFFNNSQKIIIAIIACIAMGIIIYFVYGKNNSSYEEINDEDILVNTTINKSSNEEIIVHITGAVKKEGIVTLKENSRVNDAVEAAGGLRDDADMSKINLAYVLEDGSKIVIPSINDKDESIDEEPLTENKNENSKVNGKININKANQTELETLSGIGPSTAEKIIKYREENGKFSSIEDLKNIDGIGESKFESIEKYICVK